MAQALAQPKVRGPQDRVTKMATEFDAVQWAQINAPRGTGRDFNADFAEAVETREGLRSGMAPNQAVMRGMRARQAALDPMFELKKSQAMLNIATTAQQFQENILSSQIKKQQIDDEAADTLALSTVTKLPTWDEKLKALTEITPRSARGIQQASQLRLQLSQLRQMDWSSKAMLSIAQKNPALAMRLSTMDPNSPEFIDAVQQASIKEAAQPETVTLIETAKKYRAEGDSRSANMIEAILAERGRAKVGVVSEPRPYTITVDEGGSKITKRLTEEEYLNRPVDDEETLKLIEQYRSAKSNAASGNERPGPDAISPLPTYRSKADKLKAQLLEKGVDADTGKRITQQKKRVRVRGPGGATGTVEEGEKLPEGWSFE